MGDKSQGVEGGMAGVGHQDGGSKGELTQVKGGAVNSRYRSKTGQQSVAI